MCKERPCLTVIGCGPGNREYLTRQAQEAIRAARRVYAFPRLAAAFASLHGEIRQGTVDGILEELGGESADSAVLVSGDTGLYSLASRLSAQLGDSYQIRWIPGISSLQMLCARLGVGYEDIKVVSAHGRDSGIVGPACYHPRVLYLCGGGGPSALLEELCQAGLGHLEAVVGQCLGLGEERVVHGSVKELTGGEWATLSVVLVQNPRPTPLHTRLRDQNFVRGAVPMTKESVRELCVSRLEIAPAHVVYDIGAGTGSVSVAMARKASEGVVYAIERNSQALELIAANRQKLGACNIRLVEGTAPEAFHGLPRPDKVFLGGSGGAMEEILAELTTGSKPFTLCVTAVTVESLYQGVTLLERLGFAQVETDCVGITHLKKVGDYHMPQGENPVYLISGRWGV